jgi:hypothetical protein
LRIDRAAAVSAAGTDGAPRPLGLGTPPQWQRSRDFSGEFLDPGPAAELYGCDGDVQRVDEVGVEELPDGGAAATQPDVLAVGRLKRALQHCGPLAADEVERGVGQLEGGPIVVGHDKDRGVRRSVILAPVSLGSWPCHQTFTKSCMRQLLVHWPRCRQLEAPDQDTTLARSACLFGDCATARLAHAFL